MKTYHFSEKPIQTIQANRTSAVLAAKINKLTSNFRFPDQFSIFKSNLNIELKKYNWIQRRKKQAILLFSIPDHKSNCLKIFDEVEIRISFTSFSLENKKPYSSQLNTSAYIHWKITKETLLMREKIIVLIDINFLLFILTSIICLYLLNLTDEIHLSRNPRNKWL